MIKLEEARNIVLSNIKRLLTKEEVNILDSLGRVIAEDIISKVNIPPFSNSAMDGYAVRNCDTPGELKVMEEVPAGYVAKKRVSKGQAIKVMTGAPLPKGADSVVMVEDVESETSTTRYGGCPEPVTRVKIFEHVESDTNIRKAGEDIEKGEKVIKKGTILKPAQLGILASLGISRVKVSMRPHVAILVTGDEVVGISEKLAPGKIHNSNGYSLYGQVLRSGGEPIQLGIAGDNEWTIRDRIIKGIKNDALIISGGVSVGDYDLVHKTLAELDMDIKFKKVSIRPGKPAVFGILRGTPVFGLPGNPVSSMVTFELYVKPALLKMMGCIDYSPVYVDAILDEDVEKKKGLRFFTRAVTEWKGGEYRTRTTGPQGSGILKSMAIANSLMDLPSDLEFVRKGDVVRVRWLNS